MDIGGKNPQPLAITIVPQTLSHMDGNFRRIQMDLIKIRSLHFMKKVAYGNLCMTQSACAPQAQNRKNQPSASAFCLSKHLNSSVETQVQKEFRRRSTAVYLHSDATSGRASSE